jgi:mannosylglycoprotein endo-beta-mannosidase
MVPKSEIKTLLEGDTNTKYFHLVANGKHRKTRIFQLEQEEGIICGEAELKKYITKYYKTLFGPSERSMVSMDESSINDIPQVSLLENEMLTEMFTGAEVKEAIFQMEHNKAPGPDGFPLEFYQVFWFLIKDDLMTLFQEFHIGTLPIHSLNFGNIILLPKTNDPSKIQQYRPICLLNVSLRFLLRFLQIELQK